MWMKKANSDSAKRSAPKWHGSHWHHGTWWHVGHTDIRTWWPMGHTDTMTHGGIQVTLTSWHMVTYGSHWHHDTWWHITCGTTIHFPSPSSVHVSLMHAHSIQQLTLPQWASEPNQQIQAMQWWVWCTFNVKSKVPVILHGNLAHVSCHFIVVHSASWNNHGGFGKHDFLWLLYSLPAFLVSKKETFISSAGFPSTFLISQIPSWAYVHFKTLLICKSFLKWIYNQYKVNPYTHVYM